MQSGNYNGKIGVPIPNHNSRDSGDELNQTIPAGDSADFDIDGRGVLTSSGTETDNRATTPRGSGTETDDDRTQAHRSSASSKLNPNHSNIYDPYSQTQTMTDARGNRSSGGGAGRGSVPHLTSATDAMEPDSYVDNRSNTILRFNSCYIAQNFM